MSQTHNQDEISLIDILKVMYRYRWFIMISVFIVMMISVGITYNANSKAMYIVSSTIKAGSFLNTPLADEREIALKLGKMFGAPIINESEIIKFLYKNKTFEEVKKDIGVKIIEKFLGVKFAPNSNILIFNQWQSQVQFKNNQVITKSYNINSAIEVNLKLLNKIMEYLNNILEQKIKNYYQQYNEIFKYVKTEKSTINLMPLMYETPAVLIRADEDLITKERTSLKKVAVISFSLSLFLSIFIIFVIDYLRKIDWQVIKKSK